MSSFALLLFARLVSFRLVSSHLFLVADLPALQDLVRRLACELASGRPTESANDATKPPTPDRKSDEKTQLRHLVESFASRRVASLLEQVVAVRGLVGCHVIPNLCRLSNQATLPH